MAVHRARSVLLPNGVADDAVVESQDGKITAVRPARAGDPPARGGWLVPGLVNAHLHLELSWLAGRVAARAAGFGEWAGRLIEARRAGHAPDEDRLAAVTAARAMAAGGTVAVGDVSNGGWTSGPLGDAGLSGVVFVEVLGLAQEVQGERMARAAEPAHAEGSVVVRPAPHAVYSTPPALLVAACGARGGAPAAIHVGESPGEEAFLHGEGPIVAFVDGLGLDWRWWDLPRCSPIAWLDRLGVLGPDLLLVHGVHLSAADIALVRTSGAPLCLCPRSNLHIGGQLPDVPALLAAGIPLALGTDSLASCADLDVLGEVRTLHGAFPAVPIETWLRAATEGGARALRFGVGEIAVGAAARMVWIDDDLDNRELCG